MKHLNLKGLKKLVRFEVKFALNEAKLWHGISHRLWQYSLRCESDRHRWNSYRRQQSMEFFEQAAAVAVPMT